MRARPGLAWRVFLGTGAIVAMVLAVALVVASASVRRSSDEAARRGLEQAADLVAQFLAGRERSLAGGARVFVQGPYFRSLVAERRRDDILDQAFEAQEQLDADWVFITDERGVLLAKSDEPGAAGDPLGAIPLVNGALRGQVTSGFGVSRDTLLFQTVAVPIVIPGGAPVGVLVATKRVDSLLARDVNAATASEVVFYTLAGDRPLVAASTLGRGDDVARAITMLVGARGADAARGPRPPIAIGGTTFVEQGAALTTAGGEVVGGFLVLRSPDAERTGIAGVRRSLLAAAVLGLALALSAAWATTHRLVRPMRALAAAARRAADGDHAADVDRAPVHGVVPEVDAMGDAIQAVLADVRDRRLLTTIGAAASAVRADASLTARPVAHAASDTASARPELRLAGGTGPRRAARDVEPPAAAPADAGRAGAGRTTADQLVAGRYALERVLGSGGMGTVYLAFDRTRAEHVALKLLRPELAQADPVALRRLGDELALVRRIAHRSVVHGYEVGESGGAPFVSMEYVEGPSLAALLDATGPLPPAAVLALARQLCRGLEVTHAQGVVHGDVKPGNLLLARDGVLRLTDVAVTRLLRRPAPPAGHTPDVAGAVVGTPHYMAPEQLLGAPADARADIYAAGVVLRECLTGATAFEADSPAAFMARKLDAHGDAPRPAPMRRDGPEGRDPTRALEEIVERMTAHDPADRPASAGEVVAYLARAG